MHAPVVFLAILAVSACTQPQYSHGYRNVSGQPRTMDDLNRATAECDYEMDKMLAIAGPLAAGPNLRESCMASKGWQLVERRRIN